MPGTAKAHARGCTCRRPTNGTPPRFWAANPSCSLHFVAKPQPPQPEIQEGATPQAPMFQQFIIGGFTQGWTAGHAGWHAPIATPTPEPAPEHTHAAPEAPHFEQWWATHANQTNPAMTPEILNQQLDELLDGQEEEQF